MRTRTAALLGSVLLVALAGCGGFMPGDSGNGDVDFPDGTGPDGVTNASTVLTTHQDRLAEDSYRIRYETLYAQRGGAGNSTAVVASNATQGRQLLENDLPSRQVDSFLTGDRSISRIQLGNRTSYDTQPRSGSVDDLHHQGARPGNMLATIVGAGNYEVNETGTRDGRTLITFRTTTPVENASGQLPEDIQQFNATLQLDEDGRIWQAELFATGQTNGTDEVYYQQYRTLDVGGVVVPQPDWVNEATAD